MIPYKSKTNSPVIALIDDDETARTSIGQMLKLHEYSATIFSEAKEALIWPQILGVDCIISDIKMPDMDGEAFLKKIKENDFTPPVILITGHGDISMAVRCLKSGAYDFVEKPFDNEVLLASIARAVEKNRLQRERNELKCRLNTLTAERDSYCGIMGVSKIMQDVYQQIEIMAKSDVPVVVFGETGTGKELVARAIHSQSSRAQGPFIALNTSALSEPMLESELFGHVKGAFTGAMVKREGKISAANHGTLLLDEIEFIPLAAQVKLLRVIEDNLVFPLGQDTPGKVDVRLIATTKESLKEQVAKGLMRDDFYHRIMVLSIRVPPLRERRDDIPLLLGKFLKSAANRNGLPMPEINEKIYNEMLTYHWPGNVRELKHTAERMVITAVNGVAGPFAVDDVFMPARLLSLPASSGKLCVELENTEKSVIESLLRENKGEINGTAQSLGISRRALYERMKKYNLNKEVYKTS